MLENVIGLISNNAFANIMPDSTENNEPLGEVIDAEIVDAEIVESDQSLGTGGDNRVEQAAMTAAVSSPLKRETIADTSIARLSAKGGAVGGFLLAVLALVGMAFTSYSLTNLFLATIFLIWGLKSPLQKTTIAGFLIALASAFVFLWTTSVG